MFYFMTAFWYIAFVATSYEQGLADPPSAAYINAIRQEIKLNCEQGNYINTIERIQKCGQ